MLKSTMWRKRNSAANVKLVIGAQTDYEQCCAIALLARPLDSPPAFVQMHDVGTGLPQSASLKAYVAPVYP